MIRQALLGASGLLLLVLSAQADIKTWTGSASSDWQAAANWIPAGVPASGDNVIISAGSVTAGSAITLAGLSLSGGSLTLNAASKITNLNWTAGTLQGAGTLTVPASGSLSLGGNATKILRAQTLNLYGPAVMAGTGALVGDNGASITSHGTFDIQGNIGLGRYANGDFTFNNHGMLTKSAGTGVTGFTNRFNNTGWVSVQTGTLRLAGGGTQSGSISNAPGTTLIFDAGTHTLEAAARLTGPGTVRIDGAAVTCYTTELLTGGWVVQSGTVSFVDHPVLGPMTISGGTVGFGRASLGQVGFSGGRIESSGLGPVFGVTVTNLNWTGGTLVASGTLTVPGEGVLTMGGSASKVMRQARVENYGVAVLTGTAPVLGDGGAMFVNEGAFESQSNNGFGPYATGGFSFENRGRLTKSAGTGVTGFTNSFRNQGTVTVSVGTLRFGSGYTQTAGATRLAGGNLSVAGTVDLKGGILSGYGTVSGSVANGGDLYPGIPSGSLTVTGNYTQTGRAYVKLGGTQPGTGFGQLHVQGTVNLNGSLTVCLADAFTPSPANAFEVIKGKALAGTFSTLAGLDLGGGLQFAPTYSSTNLVLTTIAAAVTQPLGVIQVDCGHGQFELRFAGSEGQTNRVEASTNLIDWVTLLETNSAGGLVHVLDLEAPAIPARFYRGIVVP